MTQQIEVFQKPGDLQSYLEKSRSAIAMAIPPHLNADRMIRLAITQFSTNPLIRKCTGRSILGAVIVAAQLGLEIGVGGQAYLVPYKDTCTLIPGWRGLVGLLNNSGRATAWTGCVFEGDQFEFEMGSNPHILHRPGPNFGDQEKLQWVYACGKVNGSEMPVIEAWPIERVWRHRDRYNKVGRQHYSYTNPEMYARKIVLLQVLKYMPSSVTLDNAMLAANAAEAGNKIELVQGANRDSSVIIEIEADPVQTAAPNLPQREEPRAELPQEPVTSRAARKPKPAPEPAAPVVMADPPKQPEADLPLPSGEPERDETRNDLQDVIQKIKTTSGISGSDVMLWLKENRVIQQIPEKLSDLPADTLALIIEKWDVLVADTRGE